MTDLQRRVLAHLAEHPGALTGEVVAALVPATGAAVSAALSALRSAGLVAGVRESVGAAAAQVAAGVRSGRGSRARSTRWRLVAADLAAAVSAERVLRARAVLSAAVGRLRARGVAAHELAVVLEALCREQEAARRHAVAGSNGELTKAIDRVQSLEEVTPCSGTP